jgi:hypothetical protein
LLHRPIEKADKDFAIALAVFGASPRVWTWLEINAEIAAIVICSKEGASMTFNLKRRPTFFPQRLHDLLEQDRGHAVLTQTRAEV